MVEGKPKQVYMPKWEKVHGGGKMKSILYAQTELRPWWREANVHKICPVRSNAPPETEPNSKKRQLSHKLNKKRTYIPKK